MRSIVTLAFPALQRQFGVGLAGVQWVSLAYLLALVALLVPVGRWSDRYGRKLVYLYGFVVFAGASAACGLAPTLPVLIGLRVVQAAGAAMLQANSVALVATSAPGGRRRAALGIQAAAQALGLALGPVVGGLLVASAGLAVDLLRQRAGGDDRGGGRVVPAAAYPPARPRPGQRPGRDDAAGPGRGGHAGRCFLAVRPGPAAPGCWPGRQRPRWRPGRA